MIEKSRAGSRNARTRASKPTPSPIPEPFQLISASIVGTSTRKIKIPMLVLCGEWLKAIGFPIGAALYLTTDRRGEMVLHRLGLSFPRSLRIVADGVRPEALGSSRTRDARCGGRRRS